MIKRKKSTLKRWVVAIFLIAGVLFFLNWALTYRLENYLRKELSERVRIATDGFYTFSFENLNIGLYDGELGIEGAVFKPDSLVFNQKKTTDSLPEFFLEVQLDEIFFKGINLTWRLNYKKLDFDVFEIQKPIVQITKTRESTEKKLKESESIANVFYDLIRPYINRLSVDKINLNNADIKFVVEDEVMPAIYRLKDVSFHAYGFLLDENSYESGKILYSDNFEFTTNQPQVLLSNKQLVLQTNSIFLNTKDSIIRINDIQLSPQASIWLQQNKMQSDYVNASVKSVDVKGLLFDRKNKHNQLYATDFDINTTDIEYVNFKIDTIEKKTKKNDFLLPSWTLYDFVSPMFSSISIGNIAINDAKMKYMDISEDFTDTYSMQSFDFHSYNFVLDAQSDAKKQFLYSDYFSVNASDIAGSISSKNHTFTLRDFSLSTLSGIFSIKDVRLSPINTSAAPSDYMKGTVDSISMKGLAYNQAITADVFSIDNPMLEYVRIPSKKKKRVKTTSPDSLSAVEQNDVLDLITPYFNSMFVKDLYLNNGNITFIDRLNRNNNLYKLPWIRFHASNLLVNEKIIRESSYVKVDNYDFSFRNADNLFSDFRLTVKSGSFDGVGGKLLFEGVKLVSRDDVQSDLFVEVSLPILRIDGVHYEINRKANNLLPNDFRLDNVSIQAPSVTIKQGNSSSPKKDFLAQTSSNKAFPFRGQGSIKINNVNITDIDFHYSDVQQKNDLRFSSDLLQASAVNLTKNNLHVEKMQLINQHVNYLSSDFNFNARIDFSLDNLSYNTENVEIGNIYLKSPHIEVAQKGNQQSDTSSVSANANDIYAVLGAFSKRFSIGNFQLENAAVNYSQVINEKNFKQQIDTVSLHFTDLAIDTENKSVDVDEFTLQAPNLQFPLDNGFYTLSAKDIDVDKKAGRMAAKNIHLLPAYPKKEFAYIHPKHSDWFDVYAGTLELKGIDFDAYLSKGIINVDDVLVKDAELFNYKNQQIITPPKLAPFIYEGLQKFPVPLNINRVRVENLYVQYEELPRNGTVPGKIFFTDMNGTFSNFTNIVSDSAQYIWLKADGNLMGTGPFTADWYLPVDSLNDHFRLAVLMRPFDLTEMNPLISPMSPIVVKNGKLNHFTFLADASTQGASVEMVLLYDDLKIGLMKEKNGESVSDKFAGTLANWVIRDNNPPKRNAKPRESDLQITRDPYHSIFNYIWQILRPPLIESVGVSRQSQNFVTKVGNFFTKVKEFFAGKEEKK